MRNIFIIFISAIFFSPIALAADGATNSTIISDLQNNGAVTGLEGEAKVSLIGPKVNSHGKNTVSSITLKGPVRNSTVITKVKNNGVVTCLGDATCGSVTYDFTE